MCVRILEYFHSCQSFSSCRETETRKANKENDETSVSKDRDDRPIECALLPTPRAKHMAWQLIDFNARTVAQAIERCE